MNGTLSLPMFIRAYKITNDSVSDELKKYWERQNARNLTYPGVVGVQHSTDPMIRKDIKDSLDTDIDPEHTAPEWQEYRAWLNSAMAIYVTEYPYALIGSFKITHPTNIQCYAPTGGYKEFHSERNGRAEPHGSRHLVFMTYLNDISASDAGGTEFFHQGVIVQPQKGLTLIWPSDWTHTHRGIVSPTKEKCIITGWFNFDV